ncbi:MAG TPA: AbrB/MazE/SpoVT family DNA-binding domain-containing protein [Bacilli bacterium]|nr:AbrB/MazE/SpoVT family DNA-binding domain-containing protein [Bacilli bacterium]
METKIQKWGNSCGVRIPMKILNELNMKENDVLKITNNDNKIVLEKVNKKNIYELFENYDNDYVCEEFEPYDVKGNELW